MDNEPLLLNVLEMWMCLVFRCLPAATLEEWLPGDVEVRGGLGVLNIQAPVENGMEGGARERVDLSRDRDPLVRGWAEIKRGEWREKVKRELGLVEAGEKGGKEEGMGAVESAVRAVPAWMAAVSGAVGGAIGGAALMWIFLRRARGR